MPHSEPVLPLNRLAAWPAIVGAATFGLGLGGCNGDDPGDSEEFCVAVQANAPAIMNPQLATQADANDYVAMHEEIGRRVPLAIEEDWEIYVEMLRTASSVVPGDAASAERARQAAFAAQESALAVRGWISTNCGLDLATVGPVVTSNPSPTTTVPGAPPATPSD